MVSLFIYSSGSQSRWWLLLLHVKQRSRTIDVLPHTSLTSSQRGVAPISQYLYMSFGTFFEVKNLFTTFFAYNLKKNPKPQSIYLPLDLRVVCTFGGNLSTLFTILENHIANSNTTERCLSHQYYTFVST